MTTISINYDPHYFDDLFTVEEKHFWFRARNRVISTFVNQIIPYLPDGYRVLEVGCGTGNVLAKLTHLCQQGHITGVDLFMNGLMLASQRFSGSLVQADISSLPFGSSFDLVGLFDVLEHMDNDMGTLQLLKNVIKPGGWLLITVPAFPDLWSYFDEAACHKRRYLVEGIMEKVSVTGFSVEFASYFMTTIFPVVWFVRKLFRRGGHQAANIHEQVTNELNLPPLINNLLLNGLAWETWMLKRRTKLPFGTSLVLLARQK